METPLEIVERAYQAWEDQDFVEVLCALDPDVHWHQEDGLPYAGDYVGREAIAQILRDVLSDWRQFDVKPLCFSTHGGLVAVLGAYEAEGKVTGFHFEDRFIHLWSVEDGRGVWAGAYRRAAAAMRDLDQHAGTAAWHR